MNNVTGLHAKKIEQASEDDRLWFDARPARGFRMRDARPFEFNVNMGALPPGANWRVIVSSATRICVRFRLPVVVSDNIGNDELEDEQLREMFETLAPPRVLKMYELATAPMKKS